LRKTLFDPFVQQLVIGTQTRPGTIAIPADSTYNLSKLHALSNKPIGYTLYPRPVRQVIL
jgi:hypothetical protein